MRGLTPFLAAVLAGTLLVAAGCGGTKVYSVDASRACLKKAGLDVTAVPRNDLIAQTAEGGSFSVRFRDNLATVSFGDDRKGAEQIVRRYEHFKGENIGLADVLRASRNAVMLWAAHPPDAYLQTIEGCLK
jgi:hypothetical protein